MFSSGLPSRRDRDEFHEYPPVYFINSKRVAENRPGVNRDEIWQLDEVMPGTASDHKRWCGGGVWGRSFISHK
jgi:hypothetical protein